MSDPMDYSCLIDGIKVDDTGRMRALVAEEFEGERSPPKAKEDPNESGIRRYEAARDDSLHEQVQRLTPLMWREMSPARRRLMLDFTVRRIQEWEEKSAFMSRSLVVGEISLPDYLREKGAA